MASLKWVFAPITNVKPEEFEKAFGQKCLLSQHVWIERVRVQDLDFLTPYLSNIAVKPESQWGVYLSPPTEADEIWINEQVIKALTTFDFLTTGDPVQIPAVIWVGGKSRQLTVLSRGIMRQSHRGGMSHLKPGLSEAYFRKTWQMLEKACKEDTGLILCLERFTRGIRHSDTRDHILDLTIALESIIRAETEIAFRFSLCLSLISSSSPKEREEEAFPSFKLLYELRSIVVHGASQKLQKKLNKWENNKEVILKRAKGAIWYYIQFLNLPGRREWEDHLRGLALGTESFIGGSQNGRGN